VRTGTVAVGRVWFPSGRTRAGVACQPGRGGGMFGGFSGIGE
jgi:hypothetical protein